MSINPTFDDLQLYNPIQYEGYQKLKAAKTVASLTNEAEACREILDALGLLNDLQELRASC